MINRKIFCKSCPWLLLVSVVVNWWRINTTVSDICDMVIVDWISVMIVFFEQMENIPTCMLHCSFCCVFKTVFIRLRCLWSATNSILLTRQMYVRHCHISYAYMCHMSGTMVIKMDQQCIYRRLPAVVVCVLFLFCCWYIVTMKICWLFCTELYCQQ